MKNSLEIMPTFGRPNNLPFLSMLISVEGFFVPYISKECLESVRIVCSSLLLI